MIETMHINDFIQAQDDEAIREMMTSPNRRIMLVFEEGSTDCWYREAVFSRQLWYSIRQLNLDYAIRPNLLARVPFSMKTLQKLIQQFMVEAQPLLEEDEDGYRKLADEILLLFNRTYNLGRRHLTAYVGFAGAKELREIIHHPVMEDVYQNMKPTHSSQRESYMKATEFLNTHPDMKYNAFAKDFRRGIVSDKQFLTTVVGRFFINDVDNHQFKQPALAGYGRGLHNILWSAQESRDACIAELQSKTPVQKSDYLNRRLQIIAAPLANVVPGDCGSEDYLPWYVTKKDLDPLIGTYFFDETIERIRPITPQDDHLVGQTIKIRSAPTCHMLHKYGVCEVCMGKIKNQIPKEFAIGHVAVQGALSDFVQLSLSAKHLIVSREAVAFVLDKDTAKYLKFPRKDEKYQMVLQPTIMDKGVTVEFIFKTSDLRFIGDMANGIRAEDIQLATATFIKECLISITNKKGENLRHPLKISDTGRVSHFSREFLDYVIANPDMVSPAGRSTVKIDLAKWVKRQPVFTLPVKVTGVKDFMSNFENTIVYGTNKLGISGERAVGISDMMRICYNIVRECVFIPVSHLGVMIASLLIRDKQALDFRAPLPNGPREFASIPNIYAHRSLSQTMAYERRLEYIQSPTATLVGVRPNHPFDALYFPEAYGIYDDIEWAEKYGRISNMDKFTNEKKTT